MRSSHLAAMAAAVFASIPFVALPFDAARAQQAPGFYIGGGVGVALLATQATTLDVLMGTPPATRVRSSKAAFDSGFALAASAGYAIGNGLRFEMEANIRENGQSRKAGGDETRYGLFANAVYDADVGVRWVTPYVGVGIGYQIASWSHTLVTGTSDASAGDPLTASASGTTGNFAYQIIAGVAFPVEAVTGLSITAEYRFTELTGTRTMNAVAGSPSAGPFSARLRAAGDSSHSVMVGLRYAFDAVPPEDETLTSLPPGSPQRPPVSRTYIVYFDIGSATLGPHARDVVADAARASGRMAFTRIEVSGHTDRAGTHERNIALAKARSDAVAEEMVRWGVLRSAIDIHAFGEERPAVPVPAGVREAKNRRVEIVYR